MKLKDIVFLEDYFFGKQLGINCMDFDKLNYFKSSDFYKNQFEYIGEFFQKSKTQCQVFKTI